MSQPFVPVSDYTVRWDGAKPFYTLADGGKRYLSPQEVKGLEASGRGSTQTAAYLASAGAAPGQSVLKTRGSWDPTNGTWKQGINWSNLLSAGVATGLTFGASNALMGPSAGAAAATGTGATSAAGTGAATGTAAATGATTVAGHSLGQILGSSFGLNAVNQGVGALTNYFGNKASANASTHAADLEAAAAAASLDFLKQQEAQRMKEHADTEAKNYALYQDQQARLAPYRRLGTGSLGQLMRPIPGVGVQ